MDPTFVETILRQADLSQNESLKMFLRGQRRWSEESYHARSKAALQVSRARVQPYANPRAVATPRFRDSLSITAYPAAATDACENCKEQRRVENPKPYGSGTLVSSQYGQLDPRSDRKRIISRRSNPCFTR